MNIDALLAALTTGRDHATKRPTYVCVCVFGAGGGASRRQLINRLIIAVEPSSASLSSRSPSLRVGDGRSEDVPVCHSLSRTVPSC